MAAKVKMRLTRPTKGKAQGETIEVDAETADYLMANGSASRVAEPKPKSDKD